MRQTGFLRKQLSLQHHSKCIKAFAGEAHHPLAFHLRHVCFSKPKLHLSKCLFCFDATYASPWLACHSSAACLRGFHLHPTACPEMPQSCRLLLLTAAHLPREGDWVRPHSHMPCSETPLRLDLDLDPTATWDAKKNMQYVSHVVCFSMVPTDLVRFVSWRFARFVFQFGLGWAGSFLGACLCSARRLLHG